MIDIKNLILRSGGAKAEHPMKHYRCTIADLERFAAAIREDSSLNYIPEGWKLVPIEPTEEMIEAAYWNIKPDVIWGDRIAVYKAMVEAAPKPD